MGNVNRRDFIRSSLGGVVLGQMSGGYLAGQTTGGKVLGANEQIRVAVIGFHNKGKQHIANFHALPGVRVAGLCDVDRDVLGEEAAKFEQRNEKVKTYEDARAVFDDKDIDAVVVATPNHWHGLLTIWACQAGKHVYVEKPLSHTIAEGEKMVAAARKYGCVVQVGTQRRSCEGMQQAVEYVRAGKLGKIKLIRCLCYGVRESFGRVNGPQLIPRSVDYDLWSGPAPMEPLMRKRLHYDWHWFRHTGGGDTANNGVHFLDLCRWMLGEKGLPNRTLSFGGRFAWDDYGETPNTLTAIYDYASAPIVFELQNLPSKAGGKTANHYKGTRFGLVVECENGYFAGGMGGGTVYDNEGGKIESFVGDNGSTHQANFIKAVRSGNIKDLNADVLEGHLSTSLCNLANISFETGRALDVQSAKAMMQKDKLSGEALDRMQEHMSANGLDIEDSHVTMGEPLQYDPKAQRFSNLDSDKTAELMANALLRRAYRRPFVVPEEV